MKKQLQIIAGLGADKRIFSKIQWPKDFEISFLDWLDTKSHQSLVDYANTFIRNYKIDETSILIGISFGGMLASEISKITNCRYILVSSTNNPKSIYNINLLRIFVPIIPTAILNKYNLLINYLFGCKNIESTKLLKDIINKSNPSQAKDLLKYISTWNGNDTKPIFTIHGKNDRLIQPPINNQYSIDGGHFAIFENHIEITQILATELSQI